jgi:hypothetical protein
LILNALFLADAVSAPPDGKFYIHGGGLTRLTVPFLPFGLQIGVFVRLEVDESELGQTHEFRFSLIDPDGAAVGVLPQFEAPLAEAIELAESEQRFVVLAINLGISVGRGGPHRFEFFVDGERLGFVPLPVVLLTAEQLQALGAPVPLPPPSSLLAPPNRTARRHPPRR